MNVLKLFLYSFGIVISLSSCCGSNDDVPIDNTMIVHVFNLDRTDNLLDYDGSIIFDTIKLRYADNNEELDCLTDQPSRELAFLPLNRRQELESIETNELILELDSLSYTLSITYEIEEIECAGTEIRVKSYNFEGQEFEFDENLRYNTIELLVNI
jgi:hypothetical protein